MSDGQQQLCIETWLASQATPSSATTGPSTSCSGHHPAPTSPPPTPQGAASTETSPATTSRPSDLHGRPALVGLDLRTHLGSALADLTGCSHSWEWQDTPAGHAWWRLRTPGRLTSGAGPLFSAVDETPLRVPTPSAQEYGSNRGGAAGRPSLRRMIQTPLASEPRGSKQQRLGTRQPDPSCLGRMLSPTATDNLTAPSMAKWAGARELMSLLASAAERLPTCRASDADRAHGKSRRATPTARDWRSGKASEETLAKNSRPLNEQLSALGINEATALLAIYLWLMAWPIAYADTAYPSAPSKASSRGGGRRSGTRS